MLLISIISISLFHFNPSFSFEKKEPLTALGFSESLEIAKHSSFLGNGLGTFEQSFLKHNPQMVQDSTHTESFSTILNILNDLGIFGLFLFLLPFSFGIIKGFKRFLKKEQDNLEKMSFISFFILFILSFFYFLDLILMLLLFLFLGLFAGTKGKTILFKNLKPFHIFLIIACLSLTLMSIIVINYFNSLNYFSEAYYNLALEKYQDDEEIAIEYLNKSNAFLKKDKTQIGLSQLYLLKASELYTESRLLETKEEEREEKKQACEDFILLSEKTALSGTEINPFNYSAWANLGNIYNNRRYLRDEELEDETIDAYKKAIELAPYTKEAYIAIIQVFSELGNVEKREEFVEKIRVIDKDYL